MIAAKGSASICDISVAESLKLEKMFLFKWWK